MFGWLKRKKPTPPEEDKAFKLERQAVQSLANDLDAFVKIRFDPVFENFIETLRTSVQKCFQRDEAPPLTLARIEYDIFGNYHFNIVGQKCHNTTRGLRPPMIGIALL